MVLLFSGCDSECGDCSVETEVAVVVEEQGPRYRHYVEVHVADHHGYSILGASVDLTVAMVPEQRIYGTTGSDGLARFYFDALADVVVMAYACAPGYECNASDIGTVAGGGSLFIHVELNH